MIDISNICSNGWMNAIRGMRNSHNSWDKMDSKFVETDGKLELGENDLTLASKLAARGSSHSKFRRMIHVSMDIKAPLYWWKEWDTYKIGTASNSTSTMHSITKKKFETTDFAMDNFMSPTFGMTMLAILTTLNELRDKYNDEKSSDREKYAAWREIIQLLPESYMQLRTVDLNYEVLAKIVVEREHHKLTEWQSFVKEMHKLPYADQLIFLKEAVNE